MKNLNSLFYIILFVNSTGLSQGTLVFDQESSNDENYLGGAAPVQFYGTIGQSFTPSLSTVGFFRVKLYDIAPNNTIGATLVINLRSNAINGPVMGTTFPVVLADGFRNSANFFLPTAVSVVPGTKYFFQLVVQSGDNWGAYLRSDSLGDVNYAGGSFYGGLCEFPANDMWFREGVPEPTTASLVLIGISSMVAFRRTRIVRRG